MTEVVFIPRPRYVVEVGSVERMEFMDPSDSVTAVSWSFWRAYRTRQSALIGAEMLALEEAFVRVVDRGVE